VHNDHGLIEPVTILASDMYILKVSWSAAKMTTMVLLIIDVITNSSISKIMISILMLSSYYISYFGDRINKRPSICLRQL
jgi:hypothetical protein